MSGSVGPLEVAFQVLHRTSPSIPFKWEVRSRKFLSPQTLYLIWWNPTEINKRFPLWNLLLNTKHPKNTRLYKALTSTHALLSHFWLLRFSLHFEVVELPYPELSLTLFCPGSLALICLSYKNMIIKKSLLGLWFILLQLCYRVLE